MVYLVFVALFNLVLFFNGGCGFINAASNSTITIQNVTYGGVSKYGGKDFTTLLQSAVGDSTKYTLPNSTHKKFNDLFGDPKPGVVKTLTITYALQDGTSTTVSANEGGTITLAGVVQNPAIIIKNVKYGEVEGYGGKDFKTLLQNVVSDSSTYTLPNEQFKNFNALFGDPKPGVVKKLNITYVLQDGTEKTASAKEGGTVTLVGVVQNPMIIIKSVKYGEVERYGGKDFKTLLQNVIGNSLIFTLPNEQFKSFNALFGDPKPGIVKKLDITYSLQDGIEKTESSKEGGTITLAGVVQNPAIIIKSVKYGEVDGYGGKDFKTLLQNVIGSNVTYKLPNDQFVRFNALFGDPKPGIVKTLNITYSLQDGIEKTASAKEGGVVTLGTDSRKIPVEPIVTPQGVLSPVSTIIPSKPLMVSTILPSNFILEFGSAVAVASGCNEKGEPSAYALAPNRKIYKYDSHSFAENPWIEMTNETVEPTVDTNRQFVLISASSAGNDLVALRSDGSVVEYDFGDVTPVITPAATPVSTTVATTTAPTTSAVSPVATISGARTSRKIVSRTRTKIPVSRRTSTTTATTSTVTPAVTTTPSIPTTTTPATTTTSVPATPATTVQSATKDKWIILAGGLKNITALAVGDDKYLVAIGGDESGVYQHTGTGWEKVNVTPEAKGATGVAIGKDGVIFALNEAGTPLAIKKGTWVEIISPVKFKKIYAGDKDHVIAVAKDSSLWILNSKDNRFEIMKDESGKNSSNIQDAAINAYGMIFACDHINRIYHNEEAGVPASVPVVATTVPVTVTATTVSVPAVTAAATSATKTDKRATRTAVVRSRRGIRTTATTTSGAPTKASTNVRKAATTKTTAVRKVATR